MKKLFCIIMALAMVLALAACGEKKENEPVEPAEPDKQEEQEGDVLTIDDYTGMWGCGRANLRIAREAGGSVAHLHWASSAAEAAEWTYFCTFDEETKTLKSEDGVMKHITWNADGSIASEETVYSDGKAEFSIGENGMLSWNDAKEDAGKDMEFECSRAETVADSVFADGFFRLVGSYHAGESGAALKLASVACEAVRFASENQLWNMDHEQLRANMLSAWNSLSKDEQSAFDANFIDLVKYINACSDDWESAKGVFEDAGIADTMKAMLSDPIYMASWNDLIANVLTMGNSTV